MIETEMQQLVIDAVETVGGRGLKLNNRFIKGVVDLLLQLPGYPAALLEVKRTDYAKAPPYEFKLGTTKLQRDFLRDWRAAGTPTGVISFLQQKGKGIKSLQMAVYNWNAPCVQYDLGYVDSHYMLGDHTQRHARIVEILKSNIW